MADIRINALATTAASTASDDFLAVDGSSQGTRKLNAYSPTFGGNLTVSGGKGTFSNSDDGRVAAAGSILITNGNYGSTSTMGRLILSGGGGNNNTQSGWYLGSQNTAGVGGPAPYLDIGLATTDTGTSYGTFTQQFRLTSTTATFAGNLTVSGTGTSSVAGNLGIRTSSPLVPLQVAAASGSTYPVQFTTNDFANSSTGSRLLFGFTAASGNTTASIQANYDGGLTAAGLVLQPSGGNLLIGTTTDSSALLQVGTNTTTAAGGMKFGTDTSLFRQGSGFLALNSSGNDARFYIKSSAGTNGFYLRQASDGNAYFWSQDALSVIFGTNNATALTLDSSQNATFAGNNVGIGGASNSSVGLYLQSTLNSSSNYGITSAATFGSASNNIIGAIYAKLTTTAASFTVPSGIGLQIDTPTIGAASAITTNYGLKIENQTGGGTNYAIYTNGGYIRFGSLPTSSAGLPSGTVWNDAGTLKIA